MFAAREPADGPFGERACVDVAERFVDEGPSRRVRKRHAEARTVDAEGHEVARAERQVGIELDPLRHVSDQPARAVRRVAEHAHRAFGRRDKTEHELEQRRFARAVSADDADELSGFDLEREAAEDASLAAPEADVRERDGDGGRAGRGGRGHSARAKAESSRSIHACVVSFGGSVSVTGTTATRALAASASRFVVLGSTVCAL